MIYITILLSRNHLRRWGFPIRLERANWHNATSGHNLAVNAIYDDKSIVQFADPLGGTQSGWPSYYEKTAAVAGSVSNMVIW